METRMERYKRIRRERFFKTVKFMVIMFFASFMSYGLFIVNSSIKDFDVIENDNLIRLDLKNNTIDLLGRSYYIDLQIIKDIF